MAAPAMCPAERSPEMCEAVVVLNSPHRGAYAKNIRASIRVNLRQTLRSWYIYFFLLPWLPEIAVRAFGYRWARHNLRGWAVDKNSISDRRLHLYVQAVAQPGALPAGINMEEFFEGRFEIAYLPRCSHWVHLERRDEVAARIKRFIGTPDQW